MEVLSNWYETFFQGISLDLWRKAVSSEQTLAEANFLINVLECAPDARLLDVPCGNGRHSLELAKRGYQMTGMDISEQFIQEARVGSSAAGEKIEWVLSDMRHIEGRSPLMELFAWVIVLATLIIRVCKNSSVVFLRH